MEKINKAGRPTKYKPEYDEQVYRLALLGLKDIEMCAFFGVSEKSFNTWKKSYPTFLQSLKAGKLEADGKVAESLYKLAMGYEHNQQKPVFNPASGEVEVVTFNERFPPNATAIIFFLKNRRKEVWREKQAIELDTMNNEQIDAIVNAIVKK